MQANTDTNSGATRPVEGPGRAWPGGSTGLKFPARELSTGSASRALDAPARAVSGTEHKIRWVGCLTAPDP
jgi:hypothetical protein